MSIIKFYHMPESPPCRAVEMVASLVGIELEKHHINLFTKDHLKDEYLKVNPQHKVPFLVDGDLKLGESRAIMRYLANKTPANKLLYPTDPKQRARVDELLDFDIGSLYSAGSKLFRPVFFEGAELNEQSEKEYRDILDHVEARLEDGRKFLTGHDLTIGDVSVAATLTLPVGCSYEFTSYPLLVSYIGRVKESIPKYDEINDEPTENMINFIKRRRDESSRNQSVSIQEPLKEDVQILDSNGQQRGD